MSDRPKDVVRRFLSIYDQRNLDGAVELLHPDIVVHQPSNPEPKDREWYRQFGAMFHAAFPDGHHSIQAQIEEGDVVATRFTYSGTHREELMGIPPTDRRVAVTAISIDRVVGGRIVEHWFVFDALGLFQQLGAMPAPTPAAA